MESIQLRNVYSEVYTIFDKLNLISKLPNEIVLKLLDEKNDEYNFDFDRSKDLYDQITSIDTISIISYLYIKYICNDKEEKELLISKYKENEFKYHSDLKEKYDIEKLFENRIHNDIKDETKEEIKEVNSIVVHKKNIFQKILEKIIGFFKKTK